MIEKGDGVPCTHLIKHWDLVGGTVSNKVNIDVLGFV